jgi:glucan 1,4-alpha-glucosidase
MLKLFLTLLVSACTTLLYAQVIKSPDGNLTLKFELTNAGTPSYQLSFKQKPVIKESTLGIETIDVPSFTEGFFISKTETNSVNNTWDPIMGEQKTIRNNYKNY